MIWLIQIALLVLAWLVAVPAFTGNSVNVRGGFFAGLLVMLLVGVGNIALWSVLTVLTVGGTIVGNHLFFGLVGLLINGLAILCTGRLFPGILYVRDYGSAFLAALVMTLASYGVHMLV